MSRIKGNHGFDETTPLLERPTPAPGSNKRRRESDSLVSETWNTFIDGARPLAKPCEALTGEAHPAKHHRISRKAIPTKRTTDQPPTPPSSSGSSRQGQSIHSPGQEHGESGYEADDDASHRGVYPASEVGSPHRGSHASRSPPPPNRPVDAESRISSCVDYEDETEPYQHQGLLKRRDSDVSDELHTTRASRELKIHLISGILIVVWLIYIIVRLFMFERRQK